MINDLKTSSSDEIEFVDHLTVYETVTKFRLSNILHANAECEEWSESKFFRLNENKCKEMRVDFAKNRIPLPNQWKTLVSCRSDLIEYCQNMEHGVETIKVLRNWVHAETNATCSKIGPFSYFLCVITN